MTALALRAPARRGRHRLTLKRRLIRWNERVAGELGRAKPKASAGRAARSSVACLALAVLTACLTGDIPPLNTTITAAVLGVALFVTGVIL